MLPAPREADDEIDTGKAWHAIHFLLTGQARPANGLLGFLCSGGAVIAGADVGYGPPRAYTSDQVAALVATLSRLDREALIANVAVREATDLGFATEHAACACRALSEQLSPELRARLVRHLPRLAPLLDAGASDS